MLPREPAFGEIVLEIDSPAAIPTITSKGGIRRRRARSGARSR
ncbi:MAG: hypothetical protein ABSG43_24310 [Solirubrobacteraceae bacterium]